MSMNEQVHDPGWTVRLLSPTMLVSIGLLSLAGALLFAGHGNHLVDALFYLPFAGCLLMHFFMHRGRHHRSDKGGRND